MSRIEELPDDFDESLDLDAAPMNSASEERSRIVSGDGSGEDLSGLKPRSNIVDVVNKTPLFMSNLDYAADEGRHSASFS